MIKTSKIGEINFKSFKTEIFAIPDIIKFIEREKISLTTLLPSPLFWYDAELFPTIDENGDGKPDKEFGTQFKIIYYKIKTKSGVIPKDNNETIKELEKTALLISTTRIKGFEVSYVAIKNG